MGYTTFYELEALPNLPDNFPTMFEEITTYNFGNLSNDCIKWYDHDEDMCKLSAMYPNHMFILTGDGEDSDDYWQAHYYRGNMSTSIAERVLPPVDWQALGDPHTNSPELFI